MSNSKRFIDAYNRCDKALHARFGFKPSMPFTDCVRRAASLNAVVRKFEDDLSDYARLRNAIVHKSNSNMTIAEPHDDVTAHFEHIAEILETPPRASTIAHAAEVVSTAAPLKKAIAVMSKRGFSNMPVIDGGRIAGILTNKSIVCFLADRLDDIANVLDTATVGDALIVGDVYFAVTSDCPVDDILNIFEKNRKLTMVIITEGGRSDGKIKGVITVGDLVTVTKMLDTF